MKGIVLTLALSVLLLCSPSSPTADGTGTSSETIALAGTVLDTAGNAAVGATVALHVFSEEHRDYYPLQSLTQTDSVGAFFFDSIPCSTYTVVAYVADTALLGVLASLKLDASQPETVLVTAALAAPVRVSGALIEPFSPGTVVARVRGLPFSAPVDAAGRFSAWCSPDSAQKLILVYIDPSRQVAAVLVDSSIDPSATGLVDVGSIARTQLPTAGLLVFDDFEDSTYIHVWDEWWWAYNDSAEGGNSRISNPFRTDSVPSGPGAGDSGRCASVSFTLGDRRAFPFAGIGTYFRNGTFGTQLSVNLTGIRSIRLNARGSGGWISVCLLSAFAPISGILVAAPQPLTSAWTTVSVDLGDTTTLGSDGIPLSEHVRFANGLLILISGSANPVGGTLSIDDVVFDIGN